MPRIQVTVTDLPIDQEHIEVAGTAIVAADGVSIDVDGDTKRVLVKILSSRAAVVPVTALAATDAHALRGPIGDLTFDINNTEIAYLVLESSRFAQALPGRAGAPGVTRQIFLDWDPTMTGFVWAYRLPA